MSDGSDDDGDTCSCFFRFGSVSKFSFCKSQFWTIYRMQRQVATVALGLLDVWCHSRIAAIPLSYQTQQSSFKQKRWVGGVLVMLCSWEEHWKFLGAPCVFSVSCAISVMQAVALLQHRLTIWNNLTFSSSSISAAATRLLYWILRLSLVSAI